MGKKNQNRVADNLIQEMFPSMPDNAKAALLECCQQLEHHYGAFIDSGKSLGYSLEETLKNFLFLIDSGEDFKTYFGFHAFLEWPDNEDVRDNYWDCYGDYLSEPDELKNQMASRGLE